MSGLKGEATTGLWRPGYDSHRNRILTQEDPIGLAGGLNLYGFADGDPVNFSDPFGLFACPPLCDNLDFRQDRFLIPKSGKEALLFGGLAVGAAGAGFGFLAASGSATAAATLSGSGLFTGGREALRLSVKEGIEGLSTGQAANIARQLSRGAVDNIRITAGTGGAITAEFTRAGRDGYQVLMKVVNAAGETVRMVQTAYDRTGKLVHAHLWK